MTNVPSRIAKNTPAILFDLDMTLVDSSNLKSILPFNIKNNPSPHELPSLLKKQGCKIGVVTSAPEAYAREVLSSFNIRCDCLVTYSDTQAHKPDPAPLLLALKRLGAESKNAFYVGDTVSDIEASFHAGITSIGAAWGIKNRREYNTKAADITIYSPNKILNIAQLGSRSYIGELLCSGQSALLHKGSVLKWGASPKNYALGRYFCSEDPRQGASDLCKKILQLKKDDGPAEDLGRCLARFLKYLGRWKPDAVIPVPPKPGERNRFNTVMDFTCSSRIPYHVDFDTEGLRRLKDIPNYKLMSSKERTLSMGDHEILATRNNWSGRKSLLLDDVYSSGATTTACANILKKAGASDVRVLVFGKGQVSFQIHHCPACNKVLRVRSHHITRELFWVCPGFREGHCKVVLPYGGSQN